MDASSQGQPETTKDWQSKAPTSKARSALARWGRSEDDPSRTDTTGVANGLTIHNPTFGREAPKVEVGVVRSVGCVWRGRSLHV
jgi:hypothetical protein